MNRTIQFLTLCAILVCSRPGIASDKGYAPKMPENLDMVDFYLHTIDLGVLVHEKYGHTQVRVHDRLTGSDVAYTWGMFDYQDPGFALKFYRGIMKYRIGAYSTQVAHRIYQYEKRQVWEDRLELNKIQKQRMMEKIIFQMLPENREYDYQYFFDNCSTRPRDFIDFALGGKFKERYFEPLSAFSFREMVRKHQATTVMSGLGLEVTMNARLDRKMTLWEEMFLPKSLRRLLMDMPQYDEQGNPIPGTSLLTPIKSYYDAPTPEANYQVDDLYTYLAFGMIPAMCLFFLVVNRRKKSPVLAVPRICLRLFGGVLLFWSLLSFVFAAVMITSWVYSNHLDLQHNANLWLFWPVDFLLAYLTPSLIFRGSFPSKSALMTTTARGLAMAHIAAAAVCGLLALSGIIEQDLSRIFSVFGFCGLMIYLLILQLTTPRIGAGRS